ncbi:hypothetical protein OSTOST_12153 [Ostertagia ostertagi]
MKTAILFGASGFIGSYLLTELLNSTDYDQVTIVVRKELHINHPKLQTIIGDYDSLPGLKERIVANEIFIALGTTKKNTPQQDKYYQRQHWPEEMVPLPFSSSLPLAPMNNQRYFI